MKSIISSHLNEDYYTLVIYINCSQLQIPSSPI